VLAGKVRWGGAAARGQQGGPKDQQQPGRNTVQQDCSPHIVLLDVGMTAETVPGVPPEHAQLLARHHSPRRPGCGGVHASVYPEPELP